MENLEKSRKSNKNRNKAKNSNRVTIAPFGIVLTSDQIEIINDHKELTNEFEIDDNGDVYAVCSDGFVKITKNQDHLISSASSVKQNKGD